MSKRRSHITLSLDSGPAAKIRQIRMSHNGLTHNQTVKALLHLWDVSAEALRDEAVKKAGPPGTVNNGKYRRDRKEAECHSS